jgi:hypothetical protein
MAVVVAGVWAEQLYSEVERKSVTKLQQECVSISVSFCLFWGRASEGFTKTDTLSRTYLRVNRPKRNNSLANENIL